MSECDLTINSLEASEVDAPWLGHLLNQVAERFRSQTAAALEPLRLTPPMLRVLETIAVDQPLTQVQLGTRVAMDRTTIVHLVDRFEALGFARRTRSATDRRAHDMTLTEAGSDALVSARRLAREVETLILKPLSEAERRTLLCLLQAVHQPANCPEEDRP